MLEGHLVVDRRCHRDRDLVAFAEDFVDDE